MPAGGRPVVPHRATLSRAACGVGAIGQARRPRRAVRLAARRRPASRGSRWHGRRGSCASINKHAARRGVLAEVGQDQVVGHQRHLASIHRSKLEGVRRPRVGTAGGAWWVWWRESSSRRLICATSERFERTRPEGLQIRILAGYSSEGTLRRRFRFTLLQRARAGPLFFPNPPLRDESKRGGRSLPT